MRTNALTSVLVWCAACFPVVLGNPDATPHEVFTFWDTLKMDDQFNGDDRELCKKMKRPFTFDNFIAAMADTSPKKDGSPSDHKYIPGMIDPDKNPSEAAKIWRDNGFNVYWKKNTDFIDSPNFKWDGKAKAGVYVS